MSYALDQLGFLQFERLCTALLELAGDVAAELWQGDADVCRTALAPGPIGQPLVADALPGPVLLIAAWVRDPEPAAAERLARTLAAERAEMFQRARSVLVLTNRYPDPRMLAVPVVSEHAGDASVAFIGPWALSELIDRMPALRLRLPSLLGLRDLDALIDAEVLSRSAGFDRSGAEDLARVFVPTGAYDRAAAALHDHRFVVLTGPPEMGKTAIARMLALAHLTDGWEAHECTTPEQLFDRLHLDRRQLFVADDAFGSTEYRPDAGERWARQMERILRMLDDGHRLIWTSRPAPLRAGLERVHRERGAERFPQPGEVLVDASHLSADEKALILFRHAKHAELSVPVRRAVRLSGPEIVEHEHFTPERIRRLAVRIGRDDPAGALGHEIGALADDTLSEPTQAMTTSYQALGDEHRALLVAMLDTPPGPVGERDLAAAVRRHHPGGLSRPVPELVDRLTDHFLRVTERRITWVHPSWRDLVIDGLGTDAAGRGRFLGAGSVHGVLLSLSIGGGARGDRALPLLKDDADWDALGDRLYALGPDADVPEVIALLDAVRAAVRRLAGRAGEAEIRPIADALVARVKRRFDRAGGPVPLPVLESWMALAAEVGFKPVPPGLEATWVDLLPAPATAPDPDDAAALERLTEWMTLVDLLETYDGGLLKQLGYAPDRLLAAKSLVEQRPDPTGPDAKWFAPSLDVTDIPSEIRTQPDRDVRRILRDL